MNDEYSVILLVGFLVDEGRFDAARAQLAPILQRSTPSAHILNAGAVLEYKAGDVRRAVQFLDRCIAQEPRFAKCYLRRGLAARRLTGQAAAGLQYLQQAVTLNPSNPEAHYELGWLLADMGRYSEACHALLEAKARGQAGSQGLTPENCEATIRRLQTPNV